MMSDHNHRLIASLLSATHRCASPRNDPLLNSALLFAKHCNATT